MVVLLLYWGDIIRDQENWIDFMARWVEVNNTFEAAWCEHAAKSRNYVTKD